jgi:hypothetical protein
MKARRQLSMPGSVRRLRRGRAPAGCGFGRGEAGQSLIMHLDGLDALQIATVDVPTGVPMLYRFDYDLRPVPATGSRYLDPLAATDPIRIGPV